MKVLLFLILALPLFCRCLMQQRKSGAHFSPSLDFDKIMNPWNSSPPQGNLLFRRCDICSPTPNIHFLWHKDDGLFFHQTHLILNQFKPFFTLKPCCSGVIKTNKSSSLLQRENAMTTAKGQRAESNSFLRPLQALLFCDCNLSSLKDYTRTMDASQYLMNPKYWKRSVKKSTLRNLSPTMKARNPWECTCGDTNFWTSKKRPK